MSRLLLNWSWLSVIKIDRILPSPLQLLKEFRYSPTRSLWVMVAIAISLANTVDYGFTNRSLTELYIAVGVPEASTDAGAEGTTPHKSAGRVRRSCGTPHPGSGRQSGGSIMRLGDDEVDSMQALPFMAEPTEVLPQGTLATSLQSIWAAYKMSFGQPSGVLLF